MEKKCPFKKQECNTECALYIHPDELNEVVKNKLASIGLIQRDSGICSLKHMSLCMGRSIFEGSYKK